MAPLDIPARLANAVRRRQCIVFVGSGLSQGAGYPSWAELVMALVDEARKIPNARVNGLDALIAQRDYLNLAEFARTYLSPSQFSALLREKLERPVTPTRAHELLAATDYRGAITTNFDRLLETTFTLKRGWVPALFSLAEIDAVGSALVNEDFFIFKLHGEISSGTVVLTTRDYDRLILSRPHVRIFLQALFLSYTLLFVGYSLQDPDFQLILSELNLIFEGKTPTHYAMLPEPPDFTVESMPRRLNIQAIPYSTKDGHQELTDLLENLSQLRPYPQNATLAS